MTHQPLTKAERKELPARIEAAIATVCSGMAAMSIPANPRDVDLVLADCAKAIADLDAAEAERDELRAALIASGNAVGAALTDRCSSQFLCNVPAEVTLVYKRIAAQRDRAESERDAERRMRVEAEAARDDARGELDDISSESGYAVSFDEEGNGDDRTLPEFVRDLAAERDALKAKLAALVEEVNAAVDHVDHENYPLCGVYDGTKESDCTCGVLRIRTAIGAAAHGGES